MIRWFLQFIYWWCLHQRYEQKDYNLLGSNAEVAGKNLLTFRVNMRIEAVNHSETLANIYHIISHHIPYNDRLTLEPQTPQNKPVLLLGHIWNRQVFSCGHNRVKWKWTKKGLRDSNAASPVRTTRWVQHWRCPKSPLGASGLLAFTWCYFS